MFKYSVILLLSLYSCLSFADTALCTISIQDVTSGVKQNIEHTYTFKPSSNTAQIMQFELRDNSFTCRLAFFNLNSGTMLSCEFDKLGH